MENLSVIQALVGKRLSDIFKQLDMFILNFGEDLEYSFHVFCYLRIKRKREVILTYLDEYMYPNYIPISKRTYNKDEIHSKSLLRVSIENTKNLLKNAVVSEVKISQTADVTITFDNEVIIEVFTDGLYQNNEFYRFFRYNADLLEPHYVIKSREGKIVTELVTLDKEDEELYEERNKRLKEKLKLLK